MPHNLISLLLTNKTLYQQGAEGRKHDGLMCFELTLAPKPFSEFD